MSEKQKINTTNELLSQIGLNAGLTLMALATAIGIVEIPDHLKVRTEALVPVRANMSQINQEISQENSFRREREESGPNYISYSVSQRTPGRSGKR